MARQDRNIQTLAECFRLLSDPTRLRIVLTLQQRGEQTVTALCNRLKLPQPNVSRHLGLLRMGNIVEGRRDGREVYYSCVGPDTVTATALKKIVKKTSSVRLGPVCIGLAD